MDRCLHWDCGWCYYAGNESNDIQGQCNKPLECMVWIKQKAQDNLIIKESNDERRK